MEQLFGSMNDLILTHAKNDCYSCYLRKWSLQRMLDQIPTFRRIYVNASSLLIKYRVWKIIDVFDKSGLHFVRGIDLFTRMPFLCFILTTNIPFSLRPRQRVIIAIFNQTNIHSIIYSETLYRLRARDHHDLLSAMLERPKVIHTNSDLITIKNIIDLSRYGKLDNMFNVSGSRWMHRADMRKWEKAYTRGIRSSLCVGVTFVMIVVICVFAKLLLFPS